MAANTPNEAKEETEPKKNPHLDKLGEKESELRFICMTIFLAQCLAYGHVGINIWNER